jgi:hypothetical protein
MITVMMLNTTFNNISVIFTGQFYRWEKPGYPKKTIDLPQYTTPERDWNSRTIMTTTAPQTTCRTNNQQNNPT